jgi:RNA polymerase sigma factor (sigma-70 family)
MATGHEEDAHVTGLVARVLALDDHQAFAEIVALYQGRVRGFLTRLTGRRDAADDLAQETFLKAYRYLGSFEGRGRFVSWLLRVAYQEFVTSVRRPRPDAVPLDATTAIDRAVDLGDADARLTLEYALRTLEPAERAALELHYWHGLTHVEIATVLGCPIGTVKSQILRGRGKLRERLGAQVNRTESR